MNTEEINLKLNQLFRISAELKAAGDEDIAKCTDNIAYDTRSIWRRINNPDHFYYRLERIETLLTFIKGKIR